MIFSSYNFLKSKFDYFIWRIWGRLYYRSWEVLGNRDIRPPVEIREKFFLFKNIKTAHEHCQLKNSLTRLFDCEYYSWVNYYHKVYFQTAAKHNYLYSEE